MFPSLNTYFTGTWAFERDIVTAGSGALYATAKGIATFSPRGSEWQYAESGKVLMAQGQQQSSFFRNYRYVATTGGLDIYFHDDLTGQYDLYQSYGYDAATGTLAARQVHVCNKDLYEGGFQLLDDENYVHTSVISGPHKDLLITTRYAKRQQ